MADDARLFRSSLVRTYLGSRKATSKEQAPLNAISCNNSKYYVLLLRRETTAFLNPLTFSNHFAMSGRASTGSRPGGQGRFAQFKLVLLGSSIMCSHACMLKNPSADLTVGESAVGKVGRRSGVIHR